MPDKPNSLTLPLIVLLNIVAAMLPFYNDLPQDDQAQVIEAIQQVRW